MNPGCTVVSAPHQNSAESVSGWIVFRNEQPGEVEGGLGVVQVQVTVPYLCTVRVYYCSLTY